jgi:hypothetical protein
MRFFAAIVLSLSLSVASKPAKKKNNNNNNAANATPLPAGSRPAGNTPTCQTLLQGASSIIGVMQLVLNNVIARNPASTNAQTLNANMNDLAAYEQAVLNIAPMMDLAAACNGAVQSNQALLDVRSQWFAAKALMRTAQVATAQADGTSGVQPAGNARAVAITSDQAQATINAAATAITQTLQNLPAPGTGNPNAPQQPGGLPNGAQNGQSAAGGQLQPPTQQQGPPVN